MSDEATRIDQFLKQTTQHPADPLGHYSLGRALVEAGKHDDAIPSLQKALALDGKLSRVYQLLAKAQLALGRRVEAVATLKAGVTVAMQRGDLMPRNEMTASLAELGESVPQPEVEGPKVVGDGQVLDVRTGRVGARMTRAPFKNALGKLIQDNISAESFKEWIAQGTKVINELRLPMNDPQAQRVYDQHMIDFLNLRELMEKEGLKL
jgi:Fe-S cluster biosynthesis and repair protein YggX